MIEEFDEDGNGVIDWSEFCSIFGVKPTICVSLPDEQAITSPPARPSFQLWPERSHSFLPIISAPPRVIPAKAGIQSDNHHIDKKTGFPLSREWRHRAWHPTSNKILILVSANCEANNTTAYVTVARGGTNIGSSGGFAITQSANTSLPAHHSYYDSPSSTSSLTYTVQIRNNDSGNTMTFNSQNPKSSITLMEIAG